MTSSKFSSIQALRGLAALAVMLFHFRWAINNVSPGLGDTLFGWGAIGVDVFFIISGFVITLSAQKLKPGISSCLTFIKHRAIRILPVYFFILAITFALSGAMSLFHYPEKTENLISALLFMPINADHAPFYIDDSGMYGIRWTLNYEIFFYLVMAFSLISKYRWLTLILIFTALIFILPASSGFIPTLSVDGYQYHQAFFNMASNPIILLFIAGVFLGLSYPYTKRIPTSISKIFLVVCSVLTLYCIAFTSFVGHGIASSGWYLTLLVFALIINDVWIGKYIPKALIFLGEISFSLYLIHTLMNNGLGKRLESLGLSDGLLRFAVSCVLSITLAYLSWRFVERKFQRK